MPSDLKSLAEQIVERARSGEQLEAFVTHDREFSVKVFEEKVETVTSSEPRGAGVRVIDGGRAGFAYTTDVSSKGLDPLVGAARDNAHHATSDDAVVLAPAWKREPADVPGLLDPAQENVTPDDKASFAVELDRATRAADKRVRAVEESMYGDSDTTVAIATSAGISGSYRRTDAWCYSMAIAADGDDTEVGFEFDLGRGLTALDGSGVAARAADRATRILGAKKIPSGKMPVVFDPYSAAQFIGVVAAALTGESVQKGRSLFA